MRNRRVSPIVGIYMSLAMVIAAIVVGHEGLLLAAYGDKVEGVLGDQITSREKGYTNNIGRGMYGSPTSIKRNYATVSYVVDGNRFSVNVNTSVLVDTGVLSKGDPVTVVYSKNNPSQAYVISYLLFSPVSAVLIAFATFALTFIALGYAVKFMGRFLFRWKS